MAIREQKIYNRRGFEGCVNIGTADNAAEYDSAPTANSALVIMAVSLNDHWKVPIGYFLIRSLTGEQRSTLLTESLYMLSSTGAKVYSLTFDGAYLNSSMCTRLGANFNYGPLFKPYFINPATKEPCYVFFDLCHMIKLVRNCLGDKLLLKSGMDESIKWQCICDLYLLQMKVCAYQN